MHNYKSFAANAAIILSVGFCSSVFANTNEDIYVGAGIGKSTSVMKKHYGDNAFYKSPVSYNLFAGYNIDESYFGEFNYEFTTKKNRINTIGAGDYMPGSILVAAGQFNTLKTTMNLQHPTIFAGYKYPILPQAEISIAAGLALSRVKATYEIIDDDLPRLPTQADIDNSRRTFKKSKLTPAIRLAGKYDFDDNFSVRLTGTWRNLSSMKPKSPESAPGSNMQIKLKNTLTFGVGFAYSI